MLVDPNVILLMMRILATAPQLPFATADDFAPGLMTCSVPPFGSLMSAAYADVIVPTVVGWIHERGTR